MQNIPSRSDPIPRAHPAAQRAIESPTTPPVMATETHLQVEVTVNGSRCTVRLGGELDIVTVAQLRDVLHRVCEDRHRLVVVDLGELRFLSLAGLQALVEVHQTLETVGCRLLVSRPDALTVRVLAITGFDQTLHLMSHEARPLSEVAPDAAPPEATR